MKTKRGLAPTAALPQPRAVSIRWWLAKILAADPVAYRGESLE